LSSARENGAISQVAPIESVGSRKMKARKNIYERKKKRRKKRRKKKEKKRRKHTEHGEVLVTPSRKRGIPL
jgi:hypothetical protein